MDTKEQPNQSTHKPQNNPAECPVSALTSTRRQFLKFSLGIFSGAIFPNLATISNIEHNQDIIRLLAGFHSVFDVFEVPELPERILAMAHNEVVPKIYDDDRILRQNLEARLASLPAYQGGIDLIVQSLGYPHIIHNNACLLGQGYDVYNYFNPQDSQARSDYRVLEVMGWDIDEVEAAKHQLLHNQVQQLKGFVLNYDEHDVNYLDGDEIDKTFPSADNLSQRQIKRLIFVGEFSPTVEEAIARQICDDSYSPRDHLIDFIQRCQRNGIEIVVWGIDTRHDHQTTIDTNIGTNIGVEIGSKVETIEIEDGTTVFFGGTAPESNPRIKLENGTLIRVVGNKVQVITPDNPLGRDATQEEIDYYNRVVLEAKEQK